VVRRADDVTALVQAAGRGERLGHGPKAFLTLGGRTLVERAVEVMREVANVVIVGVPPDDLHRARQLCDGRALVLPGGGTRIETLLALVRSSVAPLLVLHDVVHPFVTPELSRRVIEAARAHGAAAAVVPAATSAYLEPPQGAPRRLAPGALWLTRKPIAFHRDTFEQGIARLGPAATGIGSIIAAAGTVPALIASEPWNVKVTMPDDWALAQAIAAWLDPPPAR
jgi:2-C-methyl-D-erythritol 4-phosphate cytidylyltransferase